MANMKEPEGSCASDRAISRDNKITMFTDYGETRYYYLISEYYNSESYFQFYDKKNGKYVKAGKKYPCKFFEYIWDTILCLGPRNGGGNSRWFECVDFLHKSNQHHIDMAWMMYSLEGKNDKPKGRKTNKKKGSS